MASRTKTQRAVIIFPAIAMVVSLGCVSASQAESNVAVEAKKSTTTVKKKTTSTTKPPKGAVAQTALTVLAGIKIEKERPQGYKRDLFKHWTDEDRDSCNTREEVLILESRTQAQVDAYGCKVIAGDWFSEYDGLMHTDPSNLDIDHFVPLKEAWDSGAWAWTPAQRQKFANDLSDPRSLIAVTAGENRSKGEKDPSNWIPKRSEALCSYVSDWVAVKVRWNLSMDQSEWGRVKNLLTQNCPNATIAPWGSPATTSAPVSGGTAAPNTSLAPVGSSAPQATDAPQQGGLATVTPGAYCAPEGARGTSNGKSYLCSKTNASGVPYSNGRARWRQG